jgi:hypothetical protein
LLSGGCKSGWSGSRGAVKFWVTVDSVEWWVTLMMSLSVTIHAPLPRLFCGATLFANETRRRDERAKGIISLAFTLALVGCFLKLNFFFLR